MDDEDEFEPRLGRIRNRRAGRARAYLSRVLAATNLARGAAFGGVQRGRAGGLRGRGAGVGRALRRRDMHAAFRHRRVIIKSRIVKLAGKGAAGAVAHLRYVQRDGVTRESEPGRLYGAESDTVDAREFVARGKDDRHQFRFIVSAEDGDQYDDLKPLTRRLMRRMEEDLGTRLDWVAVDHFNTGHPHTHIIVRGKDERGADLVIARDYLAAGMRERAAELVDIDLGPRSDREIETARRAEMTQERLTSIDRALLRESEAGIVSARGRDAFEQTLRAGRLRQLAAMGLATPLKGDRWRLDSDLADTLKAMGERGDIIRTMQRTFAAAALDRPASDWIVDRARPADAASLIGRIVARGLADEHADRHFLIVDATDGRTHYVAIGRGDAVAPLPEAAIVRVDWHEATTRMADRTVAEVAAANGGRYSIDAHLRHDPSATEAFAETHVRRLEAIRRTVGGVIREPDGTWTIESDHLARAEGYERARLADRPVSVEILSPLALEKLIDADAATWLDREAAAGSSAALRAAGFGAEVEDAQRRRRQWLIAAGLVDPSDEAARLPPTLLATLQRRELLRAAATLSNELGKPFADALGDGRIDGVYRRRIDLAGGRFAVIERSRDFALVPWRPVIEPRLGQRVGGVLRESGVSWTFGRARSGPVVE